MMKSGEKTDAALSCNNQKLNKMKYQVLQANRGVEKAIETANKMCRSHVLKINLMYMQQDIDLRKREIAKKKKL